MSLKKNQPVGSWEGKMFKPINCDVENWVVKSLA